MASSGASRPVKKLQVGPAGTRRVFGEGFEQRVASHSEAEFCLFLQIIRGIACSGFMKRLLSPDNIKLKVEALSKAADGSLLDNFLLAADICRLAAREETTSQPKSQIKQRVVEVCHLLKRAAGATPEDWFLDGQIYSLIARNTIDTLVELHLQPSPRPEQTRRKDATPPTHLLFVDVEQFAFFEKLLLIKEQPLLEYEARLLSYRADFKDIKINQITNALNFGCVCLPNFILLEKTKSSSDTGETNISLRLLQDHESVWSVLQSEVLLSRKVTKNRVSRALAAFTLHIHFTALEFGQEMDFCFQIFDEGDLHEVEELVSVQLRKLFAPHCSVQQSLLNFKFNNPLFRKSINSPVWFAGRSDSFRVIQYIASASDIGFDHENEDLLYARDEIEFVRRHHKELLSQAIIREVSRILEAVPVPQIIRQFQKLLSSVSEYDGRARLSTEEKTSLRCLRLLRVLEKRLARLEDLHPSSFVFPPLELPRCGEWKFGSLRIDSREVVHLAQPQQRSPFEGSSR